MTALLKAVAAIKPVRARRSMPSSRQCFGRVTDKGKKRFPGASHFINKINADVFFLLINQMILRPAPYRVCGAEILEFL